MKKERQVQLSKEFKTQASKAIISISFFILTYLIILLLTVLLTVGCIAAGITLIAIKPMFLTLALGAGLASMGILVLIFLLKFIFRSHKTDRSHLIEVTESQEPALFNLIREIVEEVGTSFPKKVYFSSDVNASVFYDSSFWSMFLPVRKNLQIGLGLVNTVTKQELKAILAHEFGHFSQRTMKVGSYVYNVNQVIFNMLYENASYEELIQNWGNLSGYFSIFVNIAVRINEGIQWVLRKLYEVVNKSYLGLSREMEFHADEIAASVTGYEPLKNSLLRMSLADHSFNDVLSFYESKISDNVKTESIYKDQSAVMHFLAEINRLTLTNKLPDITLDGQSKFDKSKLVIKNQWASHPTVEERIKRLEKTGWTNGNIPDTLANELFADIEGLQKQVTKQLFEKIRYQEEVKIMSGDTFIEEYKQRVLSDSFDKMYNGYYDSKNPIRIDLETHIATEKKVDFEDLFSDEKVDMVYTAIALQNDIQTLEGIANDQLSVKTFDYDGGRYKKRDAAGLAEKLKAELESMNERIQRNDLDIYDYFKGIEEEQGGAKELTPLYKAFFLFDEGFEAKFDVYIKLLNALQFVQVKTPFEQIRANFNGIKPLEETLKKEISLLLSDDIFTTEITPEIRQGLEKYTSGTWEYFGGNNYFNDHLDILYTAIRGYCYLLARKHFLMRKAILTYQEKLRKQIAIESEPRK